MTIKKAADPFDVSFCVIPNANAGLTDIDKRSIANQSHSDVICLFHGETDQVAYDPLAEPSKSVPTRFPGKGGVRGLEIGTDWLVYVLTLVANL